MVNYRAVETTTLIRCTCTSTEGGKWPWPVKAPDSPTGMKQTDHTPRKASRPRSTWQRKQQTTHECRPERKLPKAPHCKPHGASHTSCAPWLSRQCPCVSAKVMTTPPTPRTQENTRSEGQVLSSPTQTRARERYRRRDPAQARSFVTKQCRAAKSRHPYTTAPP